MTDYRTDRGDRVEGVVVYGRLRSGTWSIVGSDDEDGTLVVEKADGSRTVLRKIEGTAASASDHTVTPGGNTTRSCTAPYAPPRSIEAEDYAT